MFSKHIKLQILSAFHRIPSSKPRVRISWFKVHHQTFVKLFEIVCFLHWLTALSYLKNDYLPHLHRSSSTGVDSTHSNSLMDSKSQPKVRLVTSLKFELSTSQTVPQHLQSAWKSWKVNWRKDCVQIAHHFTFKCPNHDWWTTDSTYRN